MGWSSKPTIAFWKVWGSDPQKEKEKEIKMKIYSIRYMDTYGNYSKRGKRIEANNSKEAIKIFEKYLIEKGLKPPFIYAYRIVE